MTENLNNQKSLREKIFQKIESGQIKMRPKFHFILKTLLVACGIFLATLLILFLVSFIGFHLRASGIWYFPTFGWRGFAVYVGLLPWFLIILSIILILLLEVLTKHFSFVWRRPIFYSLLVIILIAVIGGFLIERTSFHPNLFLRARQGNLPLMGPIYREFGMPNFRNVYRGVVEEVTEDGFRIRTFDDQLLTVILAQEAHLPFKEEIEQKDTVVVMGERRDDTVRAFDVREIDDAFKVFERRPPRQPPRQ
jgi:hypothetical protein